MKDFNIVVFFSLLFMSACTNSQKNNDFDRGPLLENTANNQVIPAYKNSLRAFQELDSGIALIQTAPSESHLQLSRNLWKEASIAWAATAPFSFGPIDDLLIENNFHYFPIDSLKLQSAVKRDSSKNISINELGSNSRGLGALEYFLFSENMNITSKESHFVKILSENLVTLNQEILNQWESGYAEEFASSTGSDINASITLLTNQWIEVAEGIKNDKIGMPAGKIVGTDKNHLAVQSPFGNTSFAAIEASLIALQKAFNGETGKGVDDYLNALNIRDENNTTLSERINGQLDSLIKLIPKGNQSLSYLIQKEDEKIDQIYLESLNLAILLKTDLMGQLGLVTTFSDSDGD
jgi:predicted lipoprotein